MYRAWLLIGIYGLNIFSLTAQEPAEQKLLSAVRAAEAPGSDELALAMAWGRLGSYYQERGRPEEAESLHRRAVATFERVNGPDNPDSASSLNNLALSVRSLGRFQEAESLYLKSLATLEKLPGQGGNLRVIWNNLGELYQLMGRYPEAETFLHRALAAGEKTLDPRNMDLAPVLENLGGLRRNQRRFQEAGQFIQRAL
jgi:tetratricopeptide (TPR) repeat protein